MALTFLEATVAVSVLTVGAVAVTSTALATGRLDREGADHEAARRAALSLVDEVRTASRAAAVEPDGWAARLLERFDGNAPRPVPGLEPWPGEPGVLSLDLVDRETARDGALGVRLGLPRDLDLDGRVDREAVGADARLLPVVVTARWRTEGTKRERTWSFVVSAL